MSVAQSTAVSVPLNFCRKPPFQLFRILSCLSQSPQTKGIVPFCQPNTLLVLHQRAMEVFRFRILECANQQQLPRRALQQVGAPNDFGDSHRLIVGYNRKLVGGNVIATPDQKIRKIFSGNELLYPQAAILKRDALDIRHTESPANPGRNIPLPGFGDSCAAGSGIMDLVIFFMRRLQRALQVLA